MLASIFEPLCIVNINIFFEFAFAAAFSLINSLCSLITSLCSLINSVFVHFDQLNEGFVSRDGRLLLHHFAFMRSELNFTEWLASYSGTSKSINLLELLGPNGMDGNATRHGAVLHYFKYFREVCVHFL